MKRFLFVMMSVLFLSVAGGQAFAQDNLETAAAKIEKKVSTILKGLGKTISCSAGEMSKTMPDDHAQIRKILQQNWKSGSPHVIDSAFIDKKGIMKLIEPDIYSQYEGSDISGQEAVIRMMKTKKQRMRNLFLSVEGIKSVDIEYPVFSDKKQFLGSVSMLIKPDEVIGVVAAPIEKELGVKCWVMQKDGVILYETDETQIGLNIFTDPRYKNYPELIALGKRMIKEKDGQGFYSFQAQGTKNIVRKKACWKTIHFFNNDWIVVAYKEAKQ